MKLRTVSQLFNTLDPSPFRERDLAKEAEDYIVDYPEGVPKGVPIDIVLHLAAEECPRSGSSELVSAIKDYFGLRSHDRDERRRVAPSVIETSHVSAHQTRRIRCPLPASLNSAF